MKKTLRSPALAISFIGLACSWIAFPCFGADNNNAVDKTVVRQDQRLLTKQYADFRSSQISNIAYTLSVTLDAQGDSFSGEEELQFDVAPGNVSPVTIDFDSGEILSLSVNGSDGGWSYDHWFITLSADALRAGRNTVDISYRRPYATDGAGLHKFTDPENGEVYLYTQFEPYDANRFFPNFDQPNLKAVLTLDVLAPANWQIITNIRETAIEDMGDNRHWIFPPTPKMATYVYALHAGPYRMWEGMAGDIPLRLFARSALAPYVKPEEWFRPTRQSFAFYQDYFGVPYPFGKYDEIVVPDFNAGAMENIAAVTYNERYISRGKKSNAALRNLAYVIAHEMAHMWFGDLVTMNWWNGLWLNESFATYMGYLELERASDFSNTWDVFYSGNKLAAYQADQLVTTHPIELNVPSTADAFTNFDDITYDKGGSVLKQLPYFIGEDNFRTGIGDYLRAHAYGNSTLDDFVGALAEASGMDLDRWKQEWLYRSGTNTLQADFTCDGDTLSSLRLIQTVPDVASADKVLRSQRTRVGLYRYTDARMVREAAIPVTYDGAVTWVPQAAGTPCPDMVFPNDGDWAFARINLDAISRATLRDHINDFPNPTNRLMLWQSLWNSVLDTTMSLDEFLAFALDNIGTETDDNVIRQVNGNLAAAFSYYTRFGGHDDARAAIQNFLRRQLDQAQPGSESQKTWYGSFVSRAHTNDALDYLEALLGGRETVPGLEIDQDKRWNIVVALNRYEHGGYDDLLSAEAARDPSDQGGNMALAARAIRPEAAIKKDYLDIIIDDPERYKLATMRTIMAYLFPAEQMALLEANRERILAAVPALNADAGQEYLGEFANILVPDTCTRASMDRLADANMDFAGLQPVVVKSYLVAHQADQRCVAIKERLE